MAELRALLEDAGYGGVRTYIASGNVLLEAPPGTRKLAAALERLVDDAFGVTTTVILRKPRELAGAVAAHPFGADSSQTTSHSSRRVPRRLRLLGSTLPAAPIARFCWTPRSTSASRMRPVCRSRVSSRCSASLRRSGTGGRSRPWPSSPRRRRVRRVGNRRRVRWHLHAWLVLTASIRSGSPS
jgi:Protein of unknown function (DUF1697)